MSDKKIGIVMGSDSDLSTIQETLNVLDEFGVKYDVDVVSCHRSPLRAHKYAVSAEKKGYKVIIGGAGGSCTSCRCNSGVDASSGYWRAYVNV